MPSRSPTICMVAPAPREADSQPPKTSSLRAVQPRDGLDGLGQGGGDFGGLGEAAGRAVQRDQLEGHLLGHGHHDLLQLGLGAEADQPDFAAGGVLGQVGGLVERVAGPGVEDGGQHHFVLQGRAGRAGDRLQRLQRVGHDAAADDNLICGAHAEQIVLIFRAFGKRKRRNKRTRSSVLPTTARIPSPDRVRELLRPGTGALRRHQTSVIVTPIYVFDQGPSAKALWYLQLSAG